MGVTRRTDLGRPLTLKEYDDNFSAAEAANNAVLALQPVITQLGAITSVGTAVIAAADQAAAQAALGLSTAATQSTEAFAAAGHQHTASHITDLVEAVQDIVGGFFGAGTGASVTYNDAANTLTVSLTGGTSDPEAIRDAIGAALIGTAGISVVVNDAADTITLNLGAHNHAISDVTGLQDALTSKATLADITAAKVEALPQFEVLASDTLPVSRSIHQGATIILSGAGATISFSAATQGNGFVFSLKNRTGAAWTVPAFTGAATEYARAAAHTTIVSGGDASVEVYTRNSTMYVSVLGDTA